MQPSRSAWPGSPAVFHGYAWQQRVLSSPQSLLLERKKLPYAGHGLVPHGIHLPDGKRFGLGRALNLHKAATGGHDKVHVNLGAGILLIIQVQERLAVDDADT